MDDKTRLYIYAFLSRIFTEELDERALKDLYENEELLETIGEETLQWFRQNELPALKEALNIDYNSLFGINNHPIESAVMDSKNEILVGLQNPVMQFYFSHGYELNLESSRLYVPDHAGIEFGFMQSMISGGDRKAQAEFLHGHLVRWIVPFLIAVKPMADTPFYRDLCDFTIEFLLSDYSHLVEELGEIDA
ncbi:molecular chaperone TorD family protein [Hydrogenimonas sp.]|uniref:TorD/DmsD family molecular chaperone n=1 Tax=Hydrogenimonas sp. TaxID=2231112 RepID=UPI00260A27F4|nr:molecular chaperone TorD family protein [Hydrogenimonas sp.]